MALLVVAIIRGQKRAVTTGIEELIRKGGSCASRPHSLKEIFLSQVNCESYGCR